MRPRKPLTYLFIAGALILLLGFLAFGGTGESTGGVLVGIGGLSMLGAYAAELALRYRDRHRMRQGASGIDGPG